MADSKDLLRLWEALQPMIDREIEQRTRDSVRMRKMTVTTAYSESTGTVGVSEPFGDEVFLPVYGALDGGELAVNESVWVLAPYSNYSNALVYMRGDGQQDAAWPGVEIFVRGNTLVFKPNDEYDIGVQDNTLVISARSGE